MVSDKIPAPSPDSKGQSFITRFQDLAAAGNAPEPVKPGGWRMARTILLRVLAVLMAALLLFTAFLMGVLAVLTHGPSEAARNILVSSLTETSALKFLPYWFLSEGEVHAILNPAPDTYRELRSETRSVVSAPGAAEVEEGQAPAAVELTDIRGSTWKGKMLIIRDPSLIMVGTLDYFGSAGIYLKDFVAKFGALAATNAGGFEDPDGEGNGGTPDGLVIRDGSIAYGWSTGFYSNVVGFDAEHKLHVGNMTAQNALDLGMQSAVSFAPGPILIQDGVRQSGWGTSLNPRTCIGQAEDGTVYLAVIEGRYPGSLGATYDDLADLMEECGAVNAANLDGGSSSTMIYDGEQITRGSTLVGSRRLCTAILVLPPQGGVS